MNRRQTLLAALTLPFVATPWTCALAQGAPVKLLVGFAPGGSVDALARLAADAIGTATGRTTIVENRAGAAGRLAVEQVKAAAPDGDTLLVAPQGPMTLFSHVFKALKYDAAKDFVPVTRLATGDFALTIGPAVPAQDFEGFRAWLRTAGAKAAYGSPGAGTLPHFVGVSVAQGLGTPMTHVPYRGSALAMNDLAGGAIAAAVSPVTEALELHKGGRVRIIATTGAARSPFLDGVPTLKERGIDLDMPLWFAMYAPAATPAAALDKLRAAVHAGLNTPAAKEKLARLGLVPAPSGGAELMAMQAKESAMWAQVVKASGFTPED
jgi:tripartite-type tricarboxylate transporter receptor subunit TctC